MPARETASRRQRDGLCDEFPDVAGQVEFELAQSASPNDYLLHRFSGLSRWLGFGYAERLRILRGHLRHL